MKRMTEEDRALWSTVARSVRPFSRGKAKNPVSSATVFERATKTVASVRKLQEGNRPPARNGMERIARAEGHTGHPPRKPPASKPVDTGIDRKALRRIARGRTPIDSRLDLHGMTREAARMRLLDHLSFARACGQRTVLVITGKGSVGGGVLRREVPLWFATPAFRTLVSGWDVAAREHGGEGALYVRLRR